MNSQEWFDEISAIEITEVVPTNDEVGGVFFNVQLSGFSLNLHLNKYERYVSFSIKQASEANAIFEVDLPSCSSIKVTNLPDEKGFIFYPPNQLNDYRESGACINCPVKLTIFPRLAVEIRRNPTVY